MGWSIRKMAQYVQQSKFLQKLKENEEVWNQSFPTASFLIFSKNRPLTSSVANPKYPFQSKINWRSFKDIEPYCKDIKASSVVLGIDEEYDEKAIFVCPVQPEYADEMQTKFEGKFADMAMAIMSLDHSEAALVGRGYTMLTWNNDCKFCHTCGSKMTRTFSGCVKACCRGCQDKNQYPPIYPVAITRVLNHSRDKCLLVRQPRHPKGMYSCVAGFMVMK
jgi:NADH pyrophosphatase NudC (nudix superfamily)